jgi:chaperonin GroES
MKLRPLRGKMVVLRDEAEDRTKGGIILPDSAKTTQGKGKIIALGLPALGKDDKELPCELEVGDRVMFSTYMGNELTLEGVKYLVMNFDDALAVLE